MIHRRIPICLTITHAGTDVPKELPDAAVLKKKIFCDPAEQALHEIFDLTHRMDSLLIAGISPEIIELDALPGDALPEKLKEQSGIYPQTKSTRKQLRQTLHEKYYIAFYNRLAGMQAQGDIKAGMDCRIFDDRELKRDGHPRPILCLANHGDLFGEKKMTGDLPTCPPKMIRDIRDIFSARFADMAGSVLINTPVSGGYLIRRQQPPTLPWFGLHIARSLLTAERDEVSEKCIEDLRNRFENILVMICKLYAWL